MTGAATSSGTILFVDDSRTLQRVVQTVLAGAGYNVVLASDGVDAIKTFYAERPDLVLCDIEMPRMNGYLVCRLLKDDWSAASTPVIMLTCRDGAGDRYWGIKTGADAYLTKDFDAADLVSAVGAALDGRHASSAAPPAHLTDGEILSRVSDMLDRKLYEATLVNEIHGLATMMLDWRDTATSLLATLGSFADFTMAAVALLDEAEIGVRVNHPVSATDVEKMASAAIDNLSSFSVNPLTISEIDLWTADPHSYVGQSAGPDPLATFVTMPLRSRGRVVGLVALSSSQQDAFGERDLALLRVVEPAVSLVVDNARLHDRVRVG